MKIPNKVVVVGLAALAMMLAAVGAWYAQRPAPRAELACAQQRPAHFTAACLAQSQAAAARGERAAMAALAAYYDQRQPAEAVRWTRAAAKLGEPRAIGRVLAGCGETGPFAAAEAQALLPLAPAMEALHFRLGGSCAPPDLAAARAISTAELLAEPDSTGLCKVAQRYATLRLSREGAQLDSQAAQALLAECARRPQVATPVRQQADSLRQMLLREIKPVHISVD
jgi:TPR repeat protein